MSKRFVSSLLSVILVMVFSAPSSAAQASSAKSKAAGAGKKPTASKSASSKKAKARSRTASRKAAQSPAKRARARSAARAFTASADLKPMAAQLLQERTPAGFSAVESYARKHGDDTAGAVAQLVLGYARTLDGQYALAIPHLVKAQPRAGELADYAAFLLASAYGGSNNPDEMLALTADFPRRFPDSVWLRDVALMRAWALLAKPDADGAIAALEPYRASGAPAVLVALGRGHAASGDVARARELFAQVYVGQPTAPEADDAQAQLEKIASSTQSPLLTSAQRLQRASNLTQRKRYTQAAEEYRAVLREAESPAVWVPLGGALLRSGKDKDARELLQRIPENSSELTSALNAERLYYLAEIARDEDEGGRHREVVERMRATVPTSPWFERALLSAGNMYLLKRDGQQAIHYYTDLYKFFPRGQNAAYGHWKAAWLTYRMQSVDEARRLFEEQIRDYPDSGQVGAALYWLGRLAEQDGKLPVARAYYQALIERYRSFYYADLARARVREIKLTEIARLPLLNRLPAMRQPDSGATVPPAENLALQKARLLANAGMFDFAVREIERFSGAREPWAAAEIAAIYQDKGQHHRALWVMKQAVPGYYSVAMSALPRNYWETLFPRLYWTDLQKYSTAQNLDPYLVASLIRQESEFNPGALSAANARGLMQVLPDTGKKLARSEKMRGFNAGSLYEPNVNLRLGTRYFREMIDRFGEVEYALAAYNAGPHRVKAWLEEDRYGDMAEFVESIPFTETREYVQAILRNSTLYRQIYAR